MQSPGEDEEDLIGVVVNVLGELTGDARDLHVVVVHLADDVRGPQLLDLVERLVHVPLGSHDPVCCKIPARASRLPIVVWSASP